MYLQKKKKKGKLSKQFARSKLLATFRDEHIKEDRHTWWISHFVTGNIPEAKQRIVGTRRRTKTGDKGRERAREEAYRKKEKRKKVRICRVVLIMTTGVITCNYRKEWPQRSMSAVWRKNKRRIGRRGCRWTKGRVAACAETAERKRWREEEQSVERWIFARRESGHAIKTMTVKIF